MFVFLFNRFFNQELFRSDHFLFLNHIKIFSRNYQKREKISAFYRREELIHVKLWQVLDLLNSIQFSLGFYIVNSGKQKLEFPILKMNFPSS